MNYRELQLEGLPGPTHHYAGLGQGNLASAANAESPASPRQAALQGLAKMQWLYEHDVEVAILPPQYRPRLDWFDRLQIEGSLQERLDIAQGNAPNLLRAIWSASSMWAANAATVTHSPDGRLHITPANLLSSAHRLPEAQENLHILRQIFADESQFRVHEPIPVSGTQSDEGAANHMHLCKPDGSDALDIFVYGAAPDSAHYPKRFVPRQMRHAFEIIQREHGLDESRCLFWQQHPNAIDAGVFHNDVIALSHRNLLVCHEQAYVDQAERIKHLQAIAPWLEIHIITNAELSLDSLVKSYFFNAQLITVEDGSTTIIFPQECQEIPQAKACCERLLAESDAIGAIHFMDLKQSMRNGGGPACLRLRIPANDTQLNAMHQAVRFTPRLARRLEQLIQTQWPESLEVSQLTSPALVESSHEAYKNLLGLLELEPYRHPALVAGSAS